MAGPTNGDWFQYLIFFRHIEFERDRPTDVQSLGVQIMAGLREFYPFEARVGLIKSLIEASRKIVRDHHGWLSPDPVGQLQSLFARLHPEARNRRLDARSG